MSAPGWTEMVGEVIGKTHGPIETAHAFEVLAQAFDKRPFEWWKASMAMSEIITGAASFEDKAARLQEYATNEGGRDDDGG
jgi:hypothetical protein